MVKLLENLNCTKRTMIPQIPQVGMGATESVGSDRYPYTVILVVSPKKIVVRRDDFCRTDRNGMSESQTYEFTQTVEGPETTLTLRRNGRWVSEGTAMKDGHWFIGERQAYQDPCF